MAKIASNRLDFIEAAPLFDGYNNAYNLFLLSPLDDFVLDDDHQLDLVLVTIRKVKAQLSMYLEEASSKDPRIALNEKMELQVMLERLESYDESVFVNIL